MFWTPGGRAGAGLPKFNPPTVSWCEASQKILDPRSVYPGPPFTLGRKKKFWPLFLTAFAGPPNAHGPKEGAPPAQRRQRPLRTDNSRDFGEVVFNPRRKHAMDASPQNLNWAHLLHRYVFVTHWIEVTHEALFSPSFSHVSHVSRCSATATLPRGHVRVSRSPLTISRPFPRMKRCTTSHSAHHLCFMRQCMFQLDHVVTFLPCKFSSNQVFSMQTLLKGIIQRV